MRQKCYIPMYYRYGIYIQKREQNAPTTIRISNFCYTHSNILIQTYLYSVKRKNKEERRRTEKAFDQTLCLCGRLSVWVGHFASHYSR